MLGPVMLLSCSPQCRTVRLHRNFCYVAIRCAMVYVVCNGFACCGPSGEKQSSSVVFVLLAYPQGAVKVPSRCLSSQVTAVRMPK